MTINKAHCLFEQSGTFRDAFKANGIPSECYDIANDFGKTDHVVDLFCEINKAFEGGQACLIRLAQMTSLWLSFHVHALKHRYLFGLRANHIAKRTGAILIS